jgi:thioredoxin reductase (NADPH)
MERLEILIIGGGIAGLSAALYGGWLGRKVFVAERQMFGGQILNADKIENFPGFSDGIVGADLVAQLRMQALKFGAKMAYTEITAVRPRGETFQIDSADASYEATAVIVATGGEQRLLGIKGEAELEGKGVSRCATCDGAFFADKPVAVIGGGDTALDEALYLANIASKVTIIHRYSDPVASATLLARAREDSKIEFAANCDVQEILGEDGVEGLRVSDGSRLPVAGVFIAAGFEPATQLLNGVVQLDGAGHAAVDLQMQTSIPGLFVVGSARQGSAGQLASVAGDGVTAAVAAHSLLMGKPRAI